jgi:hypothetical protein
MRVELVQKPASVLLVKHTGKSPWLLLERLDVFDLDAEDVSWLRAGDFKRPREIVNTAKVDVLHIVSRVVIANLTTSPIKTFNFDGFSVADRCAARNYQPISMRYSMYGVPE